MKRHVWEIDLSSLIPVGWRLPFSSRESGLRRNFTLDSFISSPPYDPSSKFSSRTPALYHVYGWSWCQKGANIMLILVGGETTDFHILFTASKHHHSSKTCQLSKNFFSTRTLKFISGDRESSCESSFKI